jgi:hypothetical protein
MINHLCAIIIPFSKYQRTCIMVGLKPPTDWAQQAAFIEVSAGSDATDRFF